MLGLCSAGGNLSAAPRTAAARWYRTREPAVLGAVASGTAAIVAVAIAMVPDA